MLAAALAAEVNARTAESADQRDETGRRLVVRDGYHRPRKVTTTTGVVEVKAPRVNDRHVDEATGERKRFSSVTLVPKWQAHHAAFMDRDLAQVDYAEDSDHADAAIGRPQEQAA